jgi:lipoate-protein ligase A
MDSYRRVHLWIQMAFAMLDCQTELAPASLKSQAGQCFVGHEQSDLLCHGRKIAGAAQRRRKDGLLIQGSVQPPSASIGRKDWEKMMRDAGSAGYGVMWQEYQKDTQVQDQAAELAKTKYARPSYNERR